jgi:small multidrug resistance family-3 protein
VAPAVTATRFGPSIKIASGIKTLGAQGALLPYYCERLNMEKFDLPFAAWLVFLGSALLEVGGDAVVRRGLRGANIVIILAGGLMLAGYGLLVNTVSWDFSRLLGVYVAVFAIVSVMCGRFVFGENVPNSTWVGLAIIVAGGLVIQFGHAR